MKKKVTKKTKSNKNQPNQEIVNTRDPTTQFVKCLEFHQNTLNSVWKLQKFTFTTFSQKLREINVS